MDLNKNLDINLIGDIHTIEWRSNIRQMVKKVLSEGLKDKASEKIFKKYKVAEFINRKSRNLDPVIIRELSPDDLQTLIMIRKKYLESKKELENYLTPIYELALL